MGRRCRGPALFPEDPAMLEAIQAGYDRQSKRPSVRDPQAVARRLAAIRAASLCAVAQAKLDQRQRQPTNAR